MLIRFTVENFLSFRDRQTLSLLPGKGTLKAHHKSTPVNGISVLKTALVFGANASGKSNLIKAAAFARNLILNGTKPDQPITQNFFKLDPARENQPAYFDFEIQHQGKNFAYGFQCNEREILEEWLFELTRRGMKRIFERTNTTHYELDYLLRKNPAKMEQQFLEFTARSTPRNQLLLTHVRNTNVPDNTTNIAPLYSVLDWFQNTLNVVYPSSKNLGKTFEIFANRNLKSVFDDFLTYCDTGIDGVEFEQIDPSKLDVDQNLLLEIQAELRNLKSEKTTAFVANPQQNTYYLVQREPSGNLTYRVLRTKHRLAGGGYRLFDLKDESDGTRRILDLIPLVVDFLQGGNVYLVDEIERSLHPNLVCEVLDFLLDQCASVNSQLIATSHEATLLNQDIIRKDEVWFTTKNPLGGTELHALDEYAVRFDKDILKDYLLGRYRGTPKLGNRSLLEHLHAG